MHNWIILPVITYFIVLNIVFNLVDETSLEHLGQKKNIVGTQTNDFLFVASWILELRLFNPFFFLLLSYFLKLVILGLVWVDLLLTSSLDIFPGIDVLL